VRELLHSHFDQIPAHGGAVVERVESYKYLGFVVHATKKLTFGTDALVATARKALFAMRRRCALLGIRDPALQCKLFDTLVLPGSYTTLFWTQLPVSDEGFYEVQQSEHSRRGRLA